MVALNEFLLCVNNHSKHFTCVVSFNLSRQLIEIGIIIFYILKMREGSYQPLDTHETIGTGILTQAAGPKLIHEGSFRSHLMENDGIQSWTGVSDHLQSRSRERGFWKELLLHQRVLHPRHCPQPFISIDFLISQQTNKIGAIIIPLLQLI